MTRVLLRELKASLEQQRADVFATPPSDWAEFKARLGEYRATERTLTRVQELIRNPEDDLEESKS